uniref:hypothetical protein n=1 Tax=Amycolatopsis sp. CA-096443 TaxID=3239919 RepID=UPI003F495744
MRDHAAPPARKQDPVIGILPQHGHPVAIVLAGLALAAPPAAWWRTRRPRPGPSRRGRPGEQHRDRTNRTGTGRP